MTAVIEKLYPEAEIPNALDRAVLDHEAYSASRRTVYVGRQQYMDRLNAHAARDGAPLVIAGESGGGKSALHFRCDRESCRIAGKLAMPYRFVLRKLLILNIMAERVGFEPTVLVKVHTLSKRAP